MELGIVADAACAIGLARAPASFALAAACEAGGGA